MSLSFEDSLNAAKAAEEAEIDALIEASKAAAAIEDYSIMTLDNMSDGIVAYAGDDGNWMQHTGYKHYSIYSDEKVSKVSADKSISLDSNQFNITQESNSQFIPFEMPRRYDGYDLAEKAVLSIHYDRSDGKHGVANPVNVTYNDTTIRFAWLVDDYATAVSGKLKFEIHATGTLVDDTGIEVGSYVWKTKINENLNVLKSLCDDKTCHLVDVTNDTELDLLIEKIVKEVADTVVDANVAEQIEAANAAADRSEAAANKAEATAADVEGKLENYATKTELQTAKEELQTAIDGVDVSDQLVDYATIEYVDGETDAIDKEITDIKSSVTSIGASLTNNYYTSGQVDAKLADYAKTTDVEAAINDMDIEGKLGNYYNKVETDEAIAQAVSEVDVKDQLTDYAKTSYVDNKISILDSKVSTNSSNITTVSTGLAEVKEIIEGLETAPGYTYQIVYNDKDNPEVGENALALFEISDEDGENETWTLKNKVIIAGGSGGAVSSNTMKIERVTSSPLVVTTDDKVIIEYDFTLTDAGGEDIGQGNATWKLGNKVIKTETVYTGRNSVDLTEYINLGSDQKVTLITTDDIGTTQQKIWYVSVIDVKLTDSFDETRKYPAGSPVNFTFTPYGSVDKEVHFLLDGEEIATKTSSKAAAGLSDSFSVPAQEHGTHLFEIYMTAKVNGNDIESNHIVKDIIWYDEVSSVPVIATAQQEFTARQYEATNIVYTVYDPSTETPTVSLKSTYVDEDGNTVEEENKTLTLSSNTQTWSYKTDVLGEHTLTITCGETVKMLKANIVELGIDVSPITAGLVFDFNPVGYSNDDENRVWSSGDVAMSVSDNFDWVNGGYQMDENGDQYFCVKAGTTAEINYELFGDNAKDNGKQFKLIFKTTNVADGEATFLSCVSDTIGTDKIGLEMKAHEATIYGKTESLPLPYAEEEIIEFEFNITASSEAVPMVMGYEDGVSTRPMVYDSTHDFQQYKDNRVPISIGSPDCDLHIYRFKVYNSSLSDRDILNNFIADARSAEEMIARYDRNQIYKDGILDPDHLAEVCPWLRIIKLECPRFTKDKDDKVGGTNIEYIYKDGDPILDNWYATDCAHSGQGTSSNSYGPSGRNLDLILKTHKDVNNNPTITLGDGKTVVQKVSLTRDSVDVNYFNVKVNIASSENANNALLQKRYNTYNPYKRPIVRSSEAEAAKVKDTMEFYNCVVFLREYSTDEAHTEFADDNWHFYAMGNIGDSKKTDSTRLTDPSDPYECILEVMDNTLSNSTMPTGKVDESGAPVYPIDPSEWVAGNSAYDSLYADLFDETSAKDKENGLADTYGWRYIYEYDDKTDPDADAKNAEVKSFVKGKWREFYEFVVTSTDEEFKANLGNYCVLDSVLYYYLFTLRYTMTDNHAKNSFWHYGKSNDKDADGNAIRKWDLCFDYDNDTALGIDNYGRMTYRYGYEEIDYVDGTKDWVWNAPQHVFFLRIRKLFDDELCALYQRLESLDCWSADSLINQFNNWQAQFPEELWRLDIERKYIRTYTGSYINGVPYPEFLKERANGRKKTQRSQFERNQEKYIASKFRGISATTDDQVYLRCSVPNEDLVVEPNFDITLTPYSYVYLSVGYNTDNKLPEKVRAVPNQSYTFKYNAEEADIMYIYSASCLKSLGDLSACYLTNGTFGAATKIRELILGNSTEGYKNSNPMTLGFGANNLLNVINIENMSGLNASLDVSMLKNLEELYANGSNVSGILFADGGNIAIAEIPDVGSLSMKNLSYLDDAGFEATSYNNLTWLVAENSELDLIDIINNSPNLHNIRITGIDWRLEDVALLERLHGLSGIKANGDNQDESVLAGHVFVNTIKQQEYNDYQALWPDLEIEYGNLVKQHKVTFLNDDDTILDVQYVVNGELAIDPIGNTISTPVKESTVSTEYTYAGWNVNLNTTQVFGDMFVKATYTEKTRTYTVRYLSKTPTGTVAVQTTEAPYGTYVEYNEAELGIPVYTAEEGQPSYNYYLFNGWDKSGFVDGNKDITAQWSTFHYTGSGSFVDGDADQYNDLANLSPVQIYALGKLVDNGNVTLSNDTELDILDTFSFTMGYDVDYNDIEQQVIINEKTHFDGTNCVETGISLFDEDRDFVIAIDYKMNSDTASDGVLWQCYQNSNNNGIRLSKSGDNAVFSWGGFTANAASVDDREMIVLRHLKGTKTISVYNSRLQQQDIELVELENANHNTFSNELVFGCAKPNATTYRNYAVGDVYWCKVWYTDLGDATCKKLAGWTHEELSFELCSLSEYYLTYDPEEKDPMCNLALLATHLLDVKMKYNEKDTNAGGWASCDLNAYLNSRMYNALPVQIKAIVKQVDVQSTGGSKSTSLTKSGCYIFIPSAKEMNYQDQTYFPIAEGTAISYITNDPDNNITVNNVRKRTHSDGTAGSYFLRSPNVEYNNYVGRIEANGGIQSITQPTVENGILIMMAF